MATISGSPRVIIRETDISTRVPSFPGIYGAIVIPADRGPIDKPVLVTSVSALLKEFTLNEKIEITHDLSYFSASAFLEKSNKLWVKRAIGKNYKFGGATVYSLDGGPRVEEVDFSTIVDTEEDTLTVSNNWLTGSAVKFRTTSTTSGDVLTITGNATETTLFPYDVITNVSDIDGNVAPGLRLVNSADDPLAPAVTELGDGLTDFTITAAGTATLTFNSSLSATGKASVEAALTAGATNAPNSYSWNGSDDVLTIEANLTNDTVFEHDVFADVESTANYVRAGLRLVNSADDPLPPYCVALGNGLTDFSLPPSGTAQIKFSTSLNPAGKTAVETALQAGSNKTIVFAWQTASVDSLPPTLDEDTTYFVINVDPTHIKLASSLDNALNDVSVDLTSTGIGTGEIMYIDWAAGEVDPESHNFAEEPNSLFILSGANPGVWNDDISYKLWIKRTNETVDLATQVSTVTDAFEVTQKWVSGEPVKLSLSSSGASDVLPSYDDNGDDQEFANNGTYYVVYVDDTHVQLASTPSNAEAGIVLDITDQGYGTVKLEPIVQITEPDSLYPFLIQVFKGTDTTNPVGSYLCSRLEDAKDGFSKTMYIEEKLNSSSYVRAIDNLLVAPEVLPKPQPIAKKLNGGDNGDAVTDGDMMRNADDYENPENLPVTLLLDGGWTTPQYQKYLYGIAERRKDCVAILSVPYSSEDSSDYINEIAKYRRETLNANTSYAALYSSHLKIYDKYNDRNIYVSPDGYAAAQISMTAGNYEIWYPVGGNKRGVLNVLDVRRRFSSGEMDYLYNMGVNPIRYTPGKGIRIWGQKTLLARPSSLDRLNVRLLLIVIEPAIAEALEDFIFEINDAVTYSLVRTMIESYMEGIKARRGVYEYLVVCDNTNNTPDDIDNYILNVHLFIKPTKAIEYIPFTVVITPTGLDFSIARQSI